MVQGIRTTLQSAMVESEDLHAKNAGIPRVLRDLFLQAQKDSKLENCRKLGMSSSR